jgi:hypothetical protein
MAPASLVRLALGRINPTQKNLPQNVLDLYRTHNIELHQRRMRACLEEAFFNNHPILELQSLAQALWENDLSHNVLNMDDHTAWEVIKDMVPQHRMASSMSPESQDLVKRALQFRRHQIQYPREYSRMAQTLIGLVFRTDKVESGSFVLYKIRPGSHDGDAALECPLIIRPLIEKLNAEDIGCIVEGLAMLPPGLFARLFF